MNKHFLALALLLIVGFSNTALARQGEAPYGISAVAKHGVPAPEVTLAAIDADALRNAHDSASRNVGEAHAKRLAIAVGNTVALNSVRDGQWQILADGSQLWRLQVKVPGATDLHLGFETYALPTGAALWVIGADDFFEGPYTADDKGPLWVPMVPGEMATIELRLPAGSMINNHALTLTHVGAGFRDQFKHIKGSTGPNASGPCNINVVCPLGQPYSDEQRALAYYEFRADSDGNTYICTATLISDVPADRKNYVLTAAHCLATPTEAASMRLYWNYQSTACASTIGYSFAQNQTGTVLRATRADADFTLVELNQNPDPAWNLFHAGWDAGNIAPTGSIGLHHPSGDVSKVNNSPVAPSTINNCIGTGGASTSTHWYTGPYDQGTTEGGSSGSGLWIPAGDASALGKRLIGVLSGGTAACIGSVPDNGFDCYGKFSAAWNGPSPATRLRDWLDPATSGILTVAGVDNVVAPVDVDPILAARIAAERQAPGMRNQDHSVGTQARPFNPLLRTN